MKQLTMLVLVTLLSVGVVAAASAQEGTAGAPAIGGEMKTSKAVKKRPKKRKKNKKGKQEDAQASAEAK